MCIIKLVYFISNLTEKSHIMMVGKHRISAPIIALPSRLNAAGDKISYITSCVCYRSAECDDDISDHYKERVQIYTSILELLFRHLPLNTQFAHIVNIKCVLATCTFNTAGRFKGSVLSWTRLTRS